ncbi:MAG: hypothetical protein IT356_02915 [Gemmatimonadaceae bacterium]|nr:hypothetical protein [Gemmatimonadaceae bacterium]
MVTRAPLREEAFRDIHRRAIPAPVRIREIADAGDAEPRLPGLAGNVAPGTLIEGWDARIVRRVQGQRRRLIGGGQVAQPIHATVMPKLLDEQRSYDR